jgi:hypothetical protein
MSEGFPEYPRKRSIEGLAHLRIQLRGGGKVRYAKPCTLPFTGKNELLIFFLYTHFRDGRAF